MKDKIGDIICFMAVSMDLISWGLGDGWLYLILAILIAVMWCAVRLPEIRRR